MVKNKDYLVYRGAVSVTGQILTIKTLRRIWRTCDDKGGAYERQTNK